MKRSMVYALLLLMCCMCLAACGQAAEEAPVVMTEAVQETAAPAVEPTAVPTADAAASARVETVAAYAAALDDLLTRHVLPDGTEAAYDAASGADGNQFAIMDIDGDGRDELLLVYVTAPVAGQVQYVCDYDGGLGALHTELSEYPLLTFYENGVVTAGWSHNQGLAGEFWPYSLYQYDAAADRYEIVAMVDAWDKSFAATGEGGAPFPDDIDVSKTGVVYYVMPGSTYDASTPMDAADYEAWRLSHLAGAAVVEPDYRALTAETVASLLAEAGAPAV